MNCYQTWWKARLWPQLPLAVCCGRILNLSYVATSLISYWSSTLDSTSHHRAEKGRNSFKKFKLHWLSSAMFLLIFILKFTSFDNYQITFIYWHELMNEKTQTRFSGYTFLREKILWRLAVNSYTISKLTLSLFTLLK